MDNIVELYLNNYESIWDMAADANYLEDKGYAVYCYGENGELLAISEDVK